MMILAEVGKAVLTEVVVLKKSVVAKGPNKFAAALKAFAEEFPGEVAEVTEIGSLMKLTVVA